MDKNKISIIFILLFLIQCGTGAQHIKNIVTHSVENTGRDISIEYKSYDYLAEGKKDEAQSNNWDKKMLDQEIASLPKGGRLSVGVWGTNVDMGNPKTLEYVIKEKNKVVFSRKGNYVMPDYLAGGASGYDWYSSEIIDLKMEFQTNISVYVIDHLINNQWEFMIIFDKYSE